MNICFAIGTLSYGGAEKIMYNLLKALKTKGHNVSVVLIDCNNTFDGLEGICQYPIYNLKEEATNNKFKRVFKRQKRIRNAVLESKCEILVSFGVVYNVDVIQACRSMKIRIVLCERGDPIHVPESKLVRLRRKIFYYTADAFVFQTKDMQNYFSHKIQRRSIIIPNFIEKKVPEENLHIPKRNSFVTCARLDNKSKNHVSLIQSFYNFYKIDPSYKLEFYGDGPDKDYYDEIIKSLDMQNNIILHGKIDNPMEEARKCKFFVLSSNYEGMPNALIEAMAYGMPCIATDCSGGGASALITNEVNGLIVPCNDNAKMLAAMLRLSTNEYLAAQLSKKAYEINDTLEMGKIISIWERFLEDTCKREG